METNVQYYRDAARYVGEFSMQDTIGTEATARTRPQVRGLTPSRLSESFRLLPHCPPHTCLNS